MNLPVKFPSDAEVIREEVNRFRALSPEDRIRVIRGILAAGALMMRQSGMEHFLQAYFLEQKNQARTAIKEFIARHANCPRDSGSGPDLSP